jgi:outer membrane receptor protein involved in Fe transport
MRDTLGRSDLTAPDVNATTNRWAARTPIAAAVASALLTTASLCQAAAVETQEADRQTSVAGAEKPSSRLAQNDNAAQGDRSSPRTGNSSEGRELLEVVVTAQKREELLKDVPISISLLSGDALDQSSVSSAKDALASVSGVAVTDLGNSLAINVRGVGSGAPQLQAGSSPIGYYLDAVPFSFVRGSRLPDANPYDLARIEVLRGPQGTLYGASSSNGLVRILTNDANLDEFELKARSTVSGTDGTGRANYRGDAALNVPIVAGKLAARAVLGYESLGGWIDTLAARHSNDAKLRNYRLKVNARPTDSLSIAMAAWSTSSDFGGPTEADNDRQLPRFAPQPISAGYDTYSLAVGYDQPGFSLSSTSTYLHYSYHQFADVASSPAAIKGIFNSLPSDILSQEILFNSASSSLWKITAGAFFKDARDKEFDSLVGFGPQPIDYAFTNRSKSYALFAQVGRRFFNQKLEGTLGLRYFHDQVSSSDDVRNIIREQTFSATTPRAVLSWYANRNVTAYVSYSEGFRSGFCQFPTLVPAAVSDVKPDKIHNYEVGAKGEIFDGRLAFDTAVYFISWDGVQQSSSISFLGVPLNVPVNGESASGIGIDIGLTARPFDGFDVGISGSWNDLGLDGIVRAGLGNDVVFNKGDRLNLSPEYTLAGTTEYTFPVGSSGHRLGLLASVNYTSAQLVRVAASPAYRVLEGDSVLTGKVRLSLEMPSRRWRGAIFVDNIGNADPATRIDTGRPDLAFRLRPRTVGVQVDYLY